MEGSYPFSTEPIYRRDTTSPSDKATLDEITAPRHWDSDRFKAVMIATAVLNNGQAIPAPNRPDSINLASWKPFLEELQQRTINEGRETGRVVLADVERQSLVMGKSASGEEYHVSVDPTPQPGREHAQRIVAAIHVHPHTTGAAFIGHGFSAGDYTTFLSNRTAQVALLGYGRDNWVMVLKTSVTPNNLSPEAARERVTACIQDVREESAGATNMQKVVAVNKEICSQLGLTMYMANGGDSTFQRIEVTN